MVALFLSGLAAVTAAMLLSTLGLGGEAMAVGILAALLLSASHAAGVSLGRRHD